MSGSTQYIGPNAVYPGLPEQTCLQQIIPAYVYTEYADDDNIQAFNTSYNNEATQFLLWFNTLNLPIYTGGIVSGALLDWVAQGVYGQARPSITTGGIESFESINQGPINAQATNSRRIKNNEVLQSTNDDVFRRMMTWNLYKGDGFQFNIQWLKRRVLRFMNGANGISPTIDQTLSCSVSVSGSVFTVYVLGAPALGQTLNSLIQSGACIIPFMYSVNVTATPYLTPGLFSDGGAVALINPPDGYPTSPTSLGAGALYSNGGLVCVAGTTTPSGSPVYFNGLTAASLLALGGANLPLSNPGVGTGELWNNGGTVSVA